MAKVIVHVNQHVIKYNAKHGTKLPSLTIKHPREGTLYAYEVHGIGSVVDSNSRGRNPLSCGARVWMEYGEHSFEIIGESWTFPMLQEKMTAEQKRELSV